MHLQHLKSVRVTSALRLRGPWLLCSRVRVGREAGQHPPQAVQPGARGRWALPVGLPSREPASNHLQLKGISPPTVDCKHYSIHPSFPVPGTNYCDFVKLYLLGRALSCQMDGEPWFNKRPRKIEIEFITRRSWRGTHHNVRGQVWR